MLRYTHMTQTLRLCHPLASNVNPVPSHYAIPVSSSCPSTSRFVILSRQRRISRAGTEMLRNLSMTNPHFTIDYHPLSPYHPKRERRMTHKCCNHLLRHLIVNRQPVRRNLLLCLLQRNRPRTNLGMQIIFDLIFLMEARFGTGKLRPKIRNII